MATHAAAAAEKKSRSKDRKAKAKSNYCDLVQKNSFYA